MKRHIRAGALALLFFVLGSQAPAQMNILPQLFRDLPPELQDGLPTEMTYREYTEMTRSVDFFSMFMSVWVPGYALFGVGERELGWGVVGVRAAGAGMIATGLIRQWQDIDDIWRLSAITDSPERYRRAITNLALVTGGFFINGVAWAFDVATAYRVAQNRKSYVQYKYGVLARLEGDARERQEGYIRRLARQDADRIGEDLEESLRDYLAAYPQADFAAEAQYQLGSLLATDQRDAEALMVLLRQLAVHPDPRVTPASRRLAARLVQRNRRDWEADRDLLLELIAAAPADPAAAPADPGAGPADAASGAAGPERRAGRYRRYLAGIRQLETDAFREAFVAQAAAFAEQYPDSPAAPEVLFARAEQLAALDRPEEAIIAYTQLAVAYPASERWPEAMLRIGVGLEDELGEPDYAARFYRRLSETRPGSPEAARAQERLQAM
jgi:TolA-binding protein